MEREYSNVEYRDIHFCYGQANGNAEEARRLYIAAYPDRNAPCARTFISIHRRLGEIGSFKNSLGDRGRPRHVRTVDREERIIERVEENPGTSTRKMALQEGIANSTIWETLHEELLYPFHVQKVQALYEGDSQLRVDMCNSILEKYEENNQIIETILFTDEAGFTREGIINFHNTHQWAYDNPHAIVESRHQRRFSLNVWAGIVGDHLVGPHFFDGPLNGEVYLNFLQNILPPLLENVDMQTRLNMWLLQDGAPPHFSVVVRRYLNETFRNRWIGRNGPLPWAPRSPDINPMDFFFWGHLKALVYATPVNDINDLRQRIINGCEVIQNRVGIFFRVRRHFLKSIRKCIEMDGEHFENLL